MKKRTVLQIGLALLATSVAAAAVPPRPSAAPDPTAAGGSPASDGYAPIPFWAGQTRAPRPQTSAEYVVEEVATGIAGGFSFSFLPDGRILLSERPGHVRIIDRQGRLSEPLSGMPKLWAGGPQGLNTVVPDANFVTNRTLYLTYMAPPREMSDPPPRLAGILQVAKARLSADERNLEGLQVLLDAEGVSGSLIQAGDGSLLITSGIPAGMGINSADWPQPQQLDSLMGKVLRIMPDGSVPADNPFVGRTDARPEIYALGVRDDQGVAIHPVSGKLWASENGPKGGDEINVIEKGEDYGFPLINYGREYTGKPINGDATARDGMKQPVYFWTPSIAPSGISFYSGRLFSAWQGNLFVAALAGKHLSRLVLEGERVVAEERLLTELNSRIRDVHEGADGALYVLTDSRPSPGRILRLIPKDAITSSGIGAQGRPTASE